MEKHNVQRDLEGRMFLFDPKSNFKFYKTCLKRKGRLPMNEFLVAGCSSCTNFTIVDFLPRLDSGPSWTIR